METLVWRSRADRVVEWLAAASLCLLAGHAPAQGSVAADREVLETFYHATGGPKWRGRTNWLSAAPLSNWYGITTDRSGRVTALDLRVNQLTGTIPSELGRLSRLQTLDLSWNQLTGTIPPELGQLTRLQTLDLGHNQLTGTIPPELGRLSQLQTLDLGWNQLAGLTGTIPPELGQLTRLQTLELGINRLTGPIPPELGQLTRLQILSLWSNRLTGTIPSELGRLSRLEWMDLTTNQLTGPIPPELGRLSRLQRLTLGENQLTGPIPPELGQLTRLERLQLGKSQLTGTIPPELGQLSQLQRLSLWGNRLTGTIPPELGRLTRLEWLKLGGNQLTGTIPLWLGQLTRLENLNLWGNQLTGTIPPELGRLVRLEWLSLARNQLTGTVPPELGRLARLQTLNLGWNPLTGRLPLNLTRLSELKTLDLQNTQVCVPVDAGFQEWLDTIATFRPSGLVCERTTRVLFSSSNFEVREGESVRVPVRLIDSTGDASGSVRIGLTVLAGGSASSEDYRGVPEHIDIPAAGGEASFTVKAVRDNRAEPGETLVIGFRQPLPAGVAAGHPDRATVTIREPGFKAMTDREVLGVLYRATGGPGWLRQGNWRSAAPLAEWQGVFTDRSGRVTALELGNNNLSGTIPPELGQLTNLQSLALQGNRLSGAIPVELGQLTNLRLLELPANRLSGSIPPELGRLTKLNLLELQLNNLSGSIPPELGQLPYLKWLVLHDNRLSGTIPPELGELSSLHDLILRNNPLIGPIPHDLTQLSELSELDIRNTRVCVPSDDAFQAWLDTIRTFRSSRLACSGARWISFSAASYVVKEGESVRVSVRLIDPTGDASGSVRIGLTVLPVGSASSEDYRGVPEHVDIPAAGGEASFTVKAVRDNQAEPGETLVLGFRQPLPHGVTAGEPDRVTVTIHEPGAEGVTNREVLDVLYHATGGPRWRRQVNWLSDAPLSEWEGVTTDGSGRVTELDLRHNQLAGSIPPELGRLSHLQRLDLGQNLLTGEIPPDLGGLSSLQVLHLGNNFLSGAIAPELGGPTQLEDLDLGNNRLGGRIPPELGGLTRLQRLHVGHNRLSGPIPPELGGLTQLEDLDIGNNRLSGGIPPELGGLTQLQRLDLGDNRLSGPIPPELSGLSNLRGLDLQINLLGGSVPPELGGLAQLEELDLRHNWLSGAIPPELGQLAKLRVLGLGGNRLTGTIPTEWSGLIRLEELNLRFSLVGGRIPPWLPQLPLTTLDLMATSVCVPEDAEFREWLETIEFSSSGLPCGRPADGMSSIDIAVFYTPAASRDAGGAAGIEALIDLMIAETNQAYLESGVNQQVVLVARQEVEYQEVGGSGWLALESLVDPSDGDMDEVHAIRDQAGADLVHLIASVTDAGGRARLAGAFGYTCSECDSRVFAHELGHNMGLHHDRYVRLQSRTFPYSRGYVNQRTFGFRKPRSARWRTIMSYPDQCENAGFSCDWIMRFSNPNQSYLGDPLGVPGDEPTTWVFGPADAVRALNTTRHSVAGFRPRVSGNRLTMPVTVSQARSANRIALPFPGGGLFREVAPDAREAARLRGGGALDRATLRQRQVMVDYGRLARLQDGGSPALRLNLFEDVELLGLMERRTPTYSGGYALSGRLAGMAGGSVTLVVNGSVVAGTVRLPGATFSIRAAGSARHTILQVDPSRIPRACQPMGRTQGSEEH